MHNKTKINPNKGFSIALRVTGIQDAHAFIVKNNQLITKRYSSGTKALNIIEYPTLI